MNDDEAQNLLASIHAESLVMFIGAGLSMATPSELPSASALATHCAAEYTKYTGANVPAGAERDLEGLAEFFLSSPPRARLFRDKLVDWGPFRRNPNAGHLAVADFLGCSAIQGAVTTNFDILIEKAAESLGEQDFQSALDGNEMTRATSHRPLLKLHGCMLRDRDRLLWCRRQIEGEDTDRALVLRIRSSGDWLRTNLRGRDLLFVGFWTDWRYLNDVLVRAMDGAEPRLVYVIDIDDQARLQEKAPELWQVAHSPGATFHHVQQSGADFLVELRKRYSITFFEILLKESTQTWRDLGGAGGVEAVLPQELNEDELYDLRRDVCSVSPGGIVRDRQPRNEMHVAGAVHLFAQAAGGVFRGSRYAMRGGEVVRIVNGAGQSFSSVVRRFSDGQPQAGAEEVVICVGAVADGGAKQNIVRGPRTDDVVEAGSGARWITLEEARDDSLLEARA